MGTLARTIAMLAAAIAAVAAGAAEDLGAALAACRREANDTRRLACYDRVTGRSPPAAAAVTPAPPAAAAAATAPPAAAPAAPAQPPAAPAPARPASAEESFGLERVQAQEEAQRREESARVLGALEATVLDIDTRIDGLMTFTLDNGQVWRQNAPDSMFRLKEGDRVRIQPGALKSYILSGPGKRSTRVTRVK